MFIYSNDFIVNTNLNWFSCSISIGEENTNTD